MRTVVNVSTGEVSQVPLTQEELDEIAARPPEPAPAAVCTPWQVRRAINALGLRDAIETAVAASTDQTLKDGWGVAQEFRSDDPFVLAMGAALGKTAEETRDMIAFASTL
jgi:hypothetical protein